MDIKQILADHLEWINNGTGNMANLSGFDLSGANLRGANLRGANLRWSNLSGADLSGADLIGADLRGDDLSGADLSGANLRWANLSGADLSGANLRWANLSGSNLRWANLSGADLSGSDLSGANLSGANLSGAKNIPPLVVAQTIIVPQTGTVIGWKKCLDGVIVKLRIPATAKRHNATGRKCRAERAVVVEVIGAETGLSIHGCKTKYVKGKTVVATNYDPDRWNECGGGIHFYITREEAEAHQ